MDKHQRRKAFVESLTEEQRALYRVMGDGTSISRGIPQKLI